MSSRYDEEIRAAEARLERDRRALVADVEQLSTAAQERMASPKGLLLALAVGFVLGELTAPRRSRKTRHVQSAAETTKKVGLGGLLGSALFALVRSRYGSPWMIANRLFDYYMTTQRSRRDAMRRAGTAPDVGGAAASAGATRTSGSRDLRPVPSTVAAEPLAAVAERHATR